MRQVINYPRLEPTDRWVRVVLNGETVADSKRALLSLERPGEQDYHFPNEDVREDLLEPSYVMDGRGSRGAKRFWHLRVGDQLRENAVWTYEPKEERPDLSGYLAIKWDAVDHWYEEEEEVVHHPRNPYHRVDTVKSSRHVEVFVDGVKVADTTRPYLLFETSLKPRYYLSAEDVATEYLRPSDLHTICPYKGTASYYHLTVNGETFENVVWTYPEPIPEAPKLKDLLVFWPEKDARIEILVDGEPPR